jgi:hypothetical protein
MQLTAVSRIGQLRCTIQPSLSENSPETQIYGTLKHRYLEGKVPVLLMMTQLGIQFKL